MRGFQALLDALKRDEGLRLHPYLDSSAPPRVTIGYGRNLTNKGISYSEANDLLESDAYQAVADAASLVPNWDDLNTVRQNVLANLAFNMGKAGLSSFKLMLAAVADNQFEEAANQLKASKWFNQVGKRGPRLEQEMRTGTVS